MIEICKRHRGHFCIEGLEYDKWVEIYPGIYAFDDKTGLLEICSGRELKSRMEYVLRRH